MYESSDITDAIKKKEAYQHCTETDLSQSRVATQLKKKKKVPF